MNKRKKKRKKRGNKEIIERVKNEGYKYLGIWEEYIEQNEVKWIVRTEYLSRTMKILDTKHCGRIVKK